MRQQDIIALRKRAFQNKRKDRLVKLMRRVTSWDDYKIAEVLKHRSDLIRVTRGQHRKNGDPASSHQQLIQTSLLFDGWTDDYLMSCLSWSHDKKDDYGERFTYQYNSRRYSPQMAQDINGMSRMPHWGELAFRDEVAQSDAALRSGGLRTMVNKVLDRPANDLHPLRITSERRRRKSGMKVWQTFESILPMAIEIDYMHEVIRWLANRQLDRLGYNMSELDKLVCRRLDDP